jgi:hypothetical protein
VVSNADRDWGSENVWRFNYGNACKRTRKFVLRRRFDRRSEQPAPRFAQANAFRKKTSRVETIFTRFVRRNSLNAFNFDACGSYHYYRVKGG